MCSSDVSYVMKDTKKEGTMRNEGIDADKKAQQVVTKGKHKWKCNVQRSINEMIRNIKSVNES